MMTDIDNYSARHTASHTDFIGQTMFKVNNFSQSFQINSIAKHIRVLRLDNTHIEGSYNLNGARKLEVLTAAACSMSSLNMTQCGHIRVLAIPRQGAQVAGECHKTHTLTNVSLPTTQWTHPYWDQEYPTVLFSGAPYLEEINLEHNGALDFINLKGIDIHNWDPQVESVLNEMGAGWTNTGAQPALIHNQNKFNFRNCGDPTSSEFRVLVKDATTASWINQYRGTTNNYPFLLPSYATVSWYGFSS
jgi:hypothetical protein